MKINHSKNIPEDKVVKINSHKNKLVYSIRKPLLVTKAQTFKICSIL